MNEHPGKDTMPDACNTPPHGLMFHHFHGPGFAPSQGSIDATALSRILEHYAETHRLLDAAEYLQKAKQGRLEDGDVCVTFDDSLLCQYELALPVLERFDIRAFWFVYSSVITGNLEPLEIYRRFRTEYFDTVDDFYEAFFRALAHSAFAATVDQAMRGFRPADYLSEFAFYTDGDRRFRFVRDQVLGPRDYNTAMSLMMASAGTSAEELAHGLWMDAGQLRDLDARGHLVGMHSHSHPTALADMSEAQQYEEYVTNQRILADILGAEPVTMSHPCNSYSGGTLAVLADLGIELGFRSNMQAGFHSRLEHPREDHANIVRRLAL
jgi:peptidoglycan/xylan/chitin deacetylase (PgdA/CDA1 family)